MKTIKTTFAIAMLTFMSACSNTKEIEALRASVEALKIDNENIRSKIAEIEADLSKDGFSAYKFNTPDDAIKSIATISKNSDVQSAISFLKLVFKVHMPMMDGETKDIIGLLVNAETEPEIRMSVPIPNTGRNSGKGDLVAAFVSYKVAGVEQRSVFILREFERGLYLPTDPFVLLPGRLGNLTSLADLRIQQRVSNWLSGVDPDTPRIELQNSPSSK